MGDILSKLQIVSEKIGVTETAHTIEDQIDLINEHLEGSTASTNIAEALDNLSEVADKINVEPEPTPTPTPEPTYTVVTFTGEGTELSPYVPAYEANKFYTRSGAGTTESPYVYTLLTSDSIPVSWGAADTFYTQDE